MKMPIHLVLTNGKWNHKSPKTEVMHEGNRCLSFRGGQMKKFRAVVFSVLVAVAFAERAGALESKFEVVLQYDLVWVDTDSDYQQRTYALSDDGNWKGFQNMVNPFGYVGFVLRSKNMGLTFNMSPRGHNDDDSVGQNQNKMRQFFYWWDVNDWFNLTIGQIASKHSRLGPTDVWGPSAKTALSQSNVCAFMLGFGQIFSNRIPQIQGNFRVHPHALLQIALTDPDARKTRPNHEIAGLGLDNAVITESEETRLPRVDLTLQIDYDPIQVSPSLLWIQHNYEWDAYARNNLGTDQSLEDSVTGWNFSLPFMVSLGGLTLQTELNYGENWGNTNVYAHGDNLGVTRPATGMDMPSLAQGTTRGAWDTDGQMRDTRCLGFWIDLKYKSGIWEPGIAWGYTKFENDAFNAAANDFQIDRNMWVVWLGIDLNPHMSIRPYLKGADLGELEYGDGARSGDLGNVNIYGLNFKVVF
jgi:hypothetical protein